MGFANKHTERLRKIARSQILPTQEICQILESRIDFATLRTIADFGAGTLFFSEYFASKQQDFIANSAVTSTASAHINGGGGGNSLNNSLNHHYSHNLLESTHAQKPTNKLESKQESTHTPESTYKVIAIDSIYTTLTPQTSYSNIILESSLQDALDRYTFDCFFLSDVLHHLSQDFTQTLLESISRVPLIIIKDIDSRHKFGHMMNALHDRVFNQESVRAIYPNELESALVSAGYECEYFYLPKLWYPHFLLIARKTYNFSHR